MPINLALEGIRRHCFPLATREIRVTSVLWGYKAAREMHLGSRGSGSAP
jgi:hypothetical protein